VSMGPNAGPAGASIFLVWGVPVRPWAGLLINLCSTNWVVTTNVTTGTGKEGRKKGRKEGRKNEEGVCQPGFEPVMYDFTRMWITTEPIGT
jgi:hypothetical protein